MTTTGKIRTLPLTPKKLNVRFLDKLLNAEIPNWRTASTEGTPFTIGDVTVRIYSISDQIDAIWTDDWYMGTAGANHRLMRCDQFTAIIHDNARWYLGGDLDQFENDLAILRMCFDANGLVDDEYD